MPDATTFDANGAESVRLTSLARGGGCACKLSPAELDQVLSLVGRPALADERLLVGFEGSDDAAVYRLNDDQAIVFTTDFFSPVVDDPYEFGRIAVTNALSDIYAMGGAPIMGLNLVAFPRDLLPTGILSAILDGGMRAATDAGCLIAGGHSIDDPEPKYGMAVVGMVHPDRILMNRGAKPGDLLVLTKPLGIGAITTGIKRGAATEVQARAAIDLMTTSNRAASLAAQAIGIGPDRPIHAGTDVTGFGLLGHLHEVARASGVSARIDAAAIPALDGAIELLRRGVLAGGTQRNHAWLADKVDWGDTDPAAQHLLADAQTSGGLLLACTPSAVDTLLARLVEASTPCAAVIGEIIAGPTGRCLVK